MHWGILRLVPIMPASSRLFFYRATWTDQVEPDLSNSCWIFLICLSPLISFFFLCQLSSHWTSFLFLWERGRDGEKDLYYSYSVDTLFCIWLAIHESVVRPAWRAGNRPRNRHNSGLLPDNKREGERVVRIDLPASISSSLLLVYNFSRSLYQQSPRVDWTSSVL